MGDAVVLTGAFLRYHHLGEIILAVDESPAQVLERDAERVRAQGFDHLVLWAPAGGRASVTAAGTHARIEPGAILLLELSQPFQIVTEPLAGHALVVPRSLNETRSGHPNSHSRILSGSETQLGTMLADHMRHAGGCLSDLTLARSCHLAPATPALCRALLAGSSFVDQRTDEPEVAELDAGIEPLRGADAAGLHQADGRGARHRGSQPDRRRYE